LGPAGALSPFSLLALRALITNQGATPFSIDENAGRGHERVQRTLIVDTQARFLYISSHNVGGCPIKRIEAGSRLPRMGSGAAYSGHHCDAFAFFAMIAENA